MKRKIASGIMLALLLISMLTLTFSIPALAGTLFGDLNDDGTVDLDDVDIAATSFGSHDGDPNWNPEADLNMDGIVDIDDVVLVAIHFGDTL